MIRKSLALFLVLSLVAAVTLTAFTSPCFADGTGSTAGGDPGSTTPGCEPVTPTPFILSIFWNAVVSALAGAAAAF
jgi:hypothetical protein